VVKAEGKRDSVSQVSSYKVSVGNATVRVKTFHEVGPIVMEAVNNLVAQDPEGAAGGAMMANSAFHAEQVQYELDTRREWRTIVIVHGEEVPVVVRKRRLW
jgi:hypothetical protein